MKRILTVFILTAFLATSAALAEERIYKPHSRVNDPALVMQIRQQMAHLENGFLQIETNYMASGVDYDAILKALEEMETTRRTIEKIVPNKEWKEPLKTLTSQMQKIRKAAKQNNPIALRQQVDALYDSCFKCHAANAPKYD